MGLFFPPREIIAAAINHIHNIGNRLIQLLPHNRHRMVLVPKKGRGTFLWDEEISYQTHLWPYCLNLYCAPANCVDLIVTRNLNSILMIFVKI